MLTQNIYKKGKDMSELTVSLPPELVQEVKGADLSKVTITIPPELLSVLLQALKVGGSAVLTQLAATVNTMTFSSPVVKMVAITLLNTLSSLLNNLVIPPPNPQPAPAPAPAPNPQPKPGGANGVTVDVG
jgi:hypothetical protein